MTLPLVVALKRMYLRNWSSYDASLELIPKLINCAFTWNNKPEIDYQREVPHFWDPVAFLWAPWLSLLWTPKALMLAGEPIHSAYGLLMLDHVHFLC